MYRSCNINTFIVLVRQLQVTYRLHKCRYRSWNIDTRIVHVTLINRTCHMNTRIVVVTLLQVSHL